MAANSDSRMLTDRDRKPENRVTESFARVVTNGSRHRIGGDMSVSRGGILIAFSGIPIAALLGFWVAAVPGLMIGLLLATVATVVGLFWLSNALDEGDDYCYCPEHVHSIRYPDRCCRNTSQREF